MRGRHAARRSHPVHAQKAPAWGHRLYGRGLDFTCNLSLDPYYPQYWEGKSKQQGIMEYYETTLANIRKLDCFDVYGHIDYIVRYAPNQRDA